MAWTAASLGGRERFALRLDAAARDELVAAVKAVGTAGRLTEPQRLSRADFRTPALDRQLAAAHAQVKDGIGFVLLDGLPTDGLTLAEYTAAVWMIGTRFGNALSQNARGEFVTQVIDATEEDQTPRMYRSRLELRLHTDITAMISLASWQEAAEGGESCLASALSIHNEILETAPHLLPALYRGFHHHRLGEEGPDEATTTPWRTPVFAWRGDQLSCRYLRANIAAGHRERGVALTEEEIAALDAFDAAARNPANRLAFTLKRGEMMVLNNYTVLHARTGFTQHPEPDRKRLLVRLWLDEPGFRDVPPEFNLMSGANGVPPQPGRNCTFDFKALYAADPRATGGAPRVAAHQR